MNLKELREKKLMTQQEVANAVGVTVTTVGTWERGRKRPELPNIRKLAELFKLDNEAMIQVIDETMAAAPPPTGQYPAVE